MSSSWNDLPFAPDKGEFLCFIDEIPEPGGWEVTFGQGKETFRVLLMRIGSQVWAYRNFCPHFSLPLNYTPQEFITTEDKLVMCSHHTAFFSIVDGKCVDGPCEGSFLDSIPIEIHGDEVRVG